MKKILLLSILTSFFLFPAFIHAQMPPEGIQFQAVARDLSGVPLANTAVTVRFNVQDAGGTTVYSETHNPTTDQFGLFDVVLGNGTPGLGTFPNINWEANQHQVQIDLDAGAGYVNLGTCQFQSVPYAFVADRVDMDLGEIQNVDLTGLAPGQTIVWNGTDWVPGSGGGLWSQNGADIYFNSGNVGVGDDTPASTFTVGNGDKLQISGIDGDVTFTDVQGSINFPASTAPNRPMMHMFGSGINNATRMVLAHSPPYPTWGLRYNDTVDAFTFIGGNLPVLHAQLAGNQRVGIGTEIPEGRLHVLANSGVGTPQLKLTESEVDYSRITLNNTVHPGFWDIAARTDTATNNNRLNFFLNGVGDILTINGERRVGINVFTPSFPLHVIGNEEFRGAYVYNQGPAVTSTANVYGIHTVSRQLASTANVYLNGVYANVSDADAYACYGFSTFTGNGTFNYGVLSQISGPGYAGYFVGDVYSTGAYLPSDEKLKRNVREYKQGLTTVMSLRPTTYEYQERYANTMTLPEGIQYGFLAQDMAKVLPGLTKETYQRLADGPLEEEGTQTEDLFFTAVNYVGLIPILTSAIQEQQELIDDQETTIQKLEDRLDQQAQELADLKKAVQALQQK